MEFFQKSLQFGSATFLLGKDGNFSLLVLSLSIKRILVLVSMPEIEDNLSRCRLDARDWMRFFLGLVLKPEIKHLKFSVSSQSARLDPKNSHSRLEIEKMTLADLLSVECLDGTNNCIEEVNSSTSSVNL